MNRCTCPEDWQGMDHTAGCKSRDRLCRVCNGNGVQNIKNGVATCYACGGSGWMRDVYASISDGETTT